MPGYEDYGRFLVERLKPLIDTKYRTFTGPMNTAVMGSSLGGVVSFYLGWQWPSVFGKMACLSSTFTYRDNLLDRVSSEPKRSIRIYLDSGWPGDNYEPTRSMRDRLIWKGYRPGSELFYLAFPEANTTRTRGPRAALFRSSSFSEKCRLSVDQSSGFQRRLRKYCRQLFGSEGSSVTRRNVS
jgi:pimeloyl-ACP methyl ester carboxylesterase